MIDNRRRGPFLQNASDHFEKLALIYSILMTTSCGLVSLTHTPSPMAFLNRSLGRPSHEKPFVLLVVGHSAEAAMVPNISRKPLSEISSFRTAEP